ncbi:putative PHD type zinc finger protein with BAH domain-containing protein [Sorochytrium milnesiophthora]
MSALGELASAAVFAGLLALCNIVQVFALLVKSVHKPTWVALNSKVLEVAWRYIQWSMEKKNKADITFSGDIDAIPRNQQRVMPWNYRVDKPKPPSAFVIANHLFFCDFVLEHAVAVRSRMLGHCRYFSKDSHKWWPLFGWLIGLAGFVFLKRDWAKDRRLIRRQIQEWVQEERPTWIVMYPEGTRQVPDKLKASQQYCVSRNLPILRNTLFPRTKGFSLIVDQLRYSHFQYLLDITIAVYHIPTLTFNTHFPTGLELLGRPLTDYRFHVDVAKFRLEHLPRDEEELEQWLIGRWQQKDALLQRWREKWPVVGQDAFHAPCCSFAAADCVYLMSENPGEPYFIGRIMEFVDNRTIKVAWFYRPQDVLGRRKSFDSRTLMATMHSDLNPTRAIVGKCVVKHISQISDLESYRNKDAHYVYSQFFDRFTKKTYEVVPTSQITNRPQAVLEKLRQFPFVLVEEGRQAEFTSNYKECRLCSQWVPVDDGRECITCGKSYHNNCIGNVKRMPKGYRWQCHFCTTNTVPVGLADAAPGTPPRLDAATGAGDRPQAGDDTGTRKSTSAKMAFPFTYFGAHCSNQDAFELDPEHPYYPRLASRVSAKHQALLPRQLAQLPPENEIRDNERNQIQSLQHELERFKRKIKKSAKAAAAAAEQAHHEPAADVREAPLPTLDLLSLQNMGLPPNTTPTVYLGIKPARGLDDALICDLPPDVSDSYMSQLASLPSLPDKPSSTSVLDRAVYELQQAQHNATDALAVMAGLTFENLYDGTYPSDMDATIRQQRHWTTSERALSCVGDAVWSEEEKNTFRSGVEQFGHDLQSIAKMLPSKNMRQVVQHFYLVRKTPEHEAALRQFLENHNTEKRALENQYMVSAPQLQHTPSVKLSPRKPSPDGAADVDDVQIVEPAPNDAGDDVVSDTSSLSELSSEDEDDVVPTPPHGECTNCKSSDTLRFVRTNLVAKPNARPDRARDRDRKTVARIDMDSFSIKDSTGYHIFCDECGEYWLKYGAVRYVYEEPKKRGGYRGRRKTGSESTPPPGDSAGSRPSATDSGASLSPVAAEKKPIETIVLEDDTSPEIEPPQRRDGRKRKSDVEVLVLNTANSTPSPVVPQGNETAASTPEVVVPVPSSSDQPEDLPAKRRRGRKRGSATYDFANDMIPIDLAVPGEEPTDAEIYFKAQGRRKRARTEPASDRVAPMDEHRPAPALPQIPESGFEVPMTAHTPTPPPPASPTLLPLEPAIEGPVVIGSSPSLVPSQEVPEPPPPPPPVLTPCCLCTDMEVELEPDEPLGQIVPWRSSPEVEADPNGETLRAAASSAVPEGAECAATATPVTVELRKTVELIRCADCGMCVHGDCYGVDHIPRKWRCSPCLNLRQPNASSNYTCVLCSDSQPLDVPLALKRTVGHNWIHLLCALWTPEVRFGDPVTLEPVEGVELVPAQRWQQTCYICNAYGGATIRCADDKCKRSFHVTCAHRLGYFFGLIEEPVPEAEGDAGDSGAGQLRGRPAVWCRDHVVPEHILDLPKAEKRRGRKSSAAYPDADPFLSTVITLPSNQPLYELKTKTGETIKFVSHGVYKQVLRHARDTKLVQGIDEHGGVARSAYLQKLMASRRPRVPTAAEQTGPQMLPIGAIGGEALASISQPPAAPTASAPPEPADTVPELQGMSRSSSGRIRKPTVDDMYAYDHTWPKSLSSTPVSARSSHSSLPSAASDAPTATPPGFGSLKIKLKLAAAPKVVAVKVTKCTICDARYSCVWWPVSDSMHAYSAKHVSTDAILKCHRCFSLGL